MTNWSEIITDDQYLQDMELLPELYQGSLGNVNVIDKTDPFVQVLSHLLAITRHHVRLLPEQKDLDVSDFITYIAKEIGLDLPLTSAVPQKEFLRESKAWFGRKGTEPLYEFAGDLIGSKVSIHYPAELIFRTDHRRSFLSGVTTEFGHELPFAESALARLRDGEYWSNFVYVLTVEQAQLVRNLNDLINIINSVHPAGTKMFLNVNFNFLVDGHVPQVIHDFYHEYWDHFKTNGQYPTLDNGWWLSGNTAFLSQHGGSRLIHSVYWYEALPLESIIMPSYRRLITDSLLHEFPSGKPWVCFSRRRPKTDGITYDTIYPDEDDALLDNAKRNMGLAHYTYGFLKTRTYREMRHVAHDNDNKLGDTPVWLSNLPHSYITQQLLYPTLAEGVVDLTPTGPDTFTLDFPEEVEVAGHAGAPAPALPIYPGTVIITMDEGVPTLFGDNSYWLVFGGDTRIETTAIVDFNGAGGAIEFVMNVSSLPTLANILGTLMADPIDEQSFTLQLALQDFIVDSNTDQDVTFADTPVGGLLKHTVKLEWTIQGSNRVTALYLDNIVVSVDTSPLVTGTAAPTALWLGVSHSAISDDLGDGFVGILQDVKVYDSNQVLAHHWPINDNVADGGEITDIVGNDHGTLVLGSGSWSSPSEAYQAIDDGEGNIISQGDVDFTGSTIDYTTGEVDLVINDAGDFTGMLVFALFLLPSQWFSYFNIVVTTLMTEITSGGALEFDLSTQETVYVPGLQSANGAPNPRVCRPINPNSVKVFLGDDLFDGDVSRDWWLLFKGDATYVTTPMVPDLREEGSVEAHIILSDPFCYGPVFSNDTSGNSGDNHIQLRVNPVYSPGVPDDLEVRIGGVVQVFPNAAPRHGRRSFVSIAWSDPFDVEGTDTTRAAVYVGEVNIGTIDFPTPTTDGTALYIGADWYDPGLISSYFLGVIQNVRAFTTGGVVVSDWPLDDNVADGGEITDIWGPNNGTLHLGGGSAWKQKYVSAVDDGAGNIVAEDDSNDWTGSTVNYNTGAIHIEVDDSDASKIFKFGGTGPSGLKNAGDSYISTSKLINLANEGGIEFKVRRMPVGVDQETGGVVFPIIGAATTNNNEGIGIVMQSGAIRVRIGDYFYTSGGFPIGSINRGQWYTVKVLWKDVNIGAPYGVRRLVLAYINGTLVHSSSPQTYTAGTSRNLEIGRVLQNNKFVGYIRDVKLFDGVGAVTNHWPINDDVADGGEITDVVGASHGVLHRGAQSSWETFTIPVYALAEARIIKNIETL